MEVKRAKQRRHPTNALVDGICSFLALHHTGPVTLLDGLVHGATRGNGYGDHDEVNGYANRQQGERETVDSTTERLDADMKLDVDDLPKRYTIYHPMLLLNSTFASHSPAWERFFKNLSAEQKGVLFRIVVDKFCISGQQVTHVAVNAPIELHLASGQTGATDVRSIPVGEANVMRSPLNIQPLYGDFGLDSFSATSGLGPGRVDFQAAFWVETSQLSGIKQVWAPRWTMFSRGNIREKGRILGQQSTFPGILVEELEQSLSEIDVVDFYVGIGYFALPYLKIGVRRVFGWEINGWSVEGLRRGCERNGWECLVVSVDGDLDSRARVVDIVVTALRSNRDLRCIVFHGDNRYAEGIMTAIGDNLEKDEVAINVRHCNLGLLPTSEESWKGAVSCVNSKKSGWLHVHENANISQVEIKRQHVLDAVAVMVKKNKGDEWQASCEHIEMVKTYAPGVGHYVFDIKLWRAR